LQPKTNLRGKEFEVAMSSYRLPWQELNPRAQELAGIAEMKSEMRTQTANDSDILAYPEWQKPVHEALVELDHENLQVRIATARAAISHRLETISQHDGHQAEQQAMQDALATLWMLEDQDRKLRDRGSFLGWRFGTPVQL